MKRITVPITVLTPTGSRPDAFQLCQKWMEHQTVTSYQWIVVDDGPLETPHASPYITHYLRRPPLITDPKHTLPTNILHGLEAVNTDFLIFMEDDDWYHPRYLEDMYDLLCTGCELAGYDNAVYYRLHNRSYRYMNNYEHACLCTTGVSRKAFPKLRAACRNCLRFGNPSVDLQLWSIAASKRLESAARSVGIKGMPGRPGTTYGWKHDEAGWTPDPQLRTLETLIGKENTKLYLPFIEQAAR